MRIEYCCLFFLPDEWFYDTLQWYDSKTGFPIYSATSNKYTTVSICMCKAQASLHDVEKWNRGKLIYAPQCALLPFFLLLGV